MARNRCGEGSRRDGEARPHADLLVHDGRRCSRKDSPRCWKNSGHCSARRLHVEPYIPLSRRRGEASRKTLSREKKRRSEGNRSYLLTWQSSTFPREGRRKEKGREGAVELLALLHFLRRSSMCSKGKRGRSARRGRRAEDLQKIAN